MALRSGRFKSTGPGSDNSQVVAKGRHGTLRVYNAGDSAFDVTVASSSSTSSSVTLEKDRSIDIVIGNQATSVSVSAGDNVAFEGIYEFVQDDSPIRSGHFKGVGDPDAIMIVHQGGGGVYRVMNSGDYPFTVNIEGDEIGEVAPAFSLDFAAEGNVTITGAASEQLEGIFDALFENVDVRSGRFRFRPDVDIEGEAIIVPSYPLPIIDLTGTPSTKGYWYRIFNSGDEIIVVQHKNGGGVTELGRVQPQSSFDFQVPDQPAKRLISVKSADLTKVIQGSFDLVNDPKS